MSEPHKKSGRKLWATVLVTLAAVVALGWMLRQVDWQQAFATWDKVPVHVWLLSGAGLAASHLLRAGRVRAEWCKQLRLGWREAWGLMVRHSAWVVLVPMRGGEAIYVWALHRQGGVPLRQAGLSLLRLRLQDMAVLAVLAAALFAPLAWYWRLLLLAAMLVAAIWLLPAIWFIVQERAIRRSGESGRQLPPPAWASWAYAVSNWMVKLAAIAWPLLSLLPIDLDAALKGATGGELAAALPVQPPAGFGPYEAGVIAAIRSAADAPWADIALAALVVHLLALAVTVGSSIVARLLGWSHRDLRRHPSGPGPA
ncbi:MAG: hypothetical protein RLZZ555_1714 [Pseudomonadota bacterium]|jgi:Lysylphosphatidylglycerol synthase TM region